MNKEHFIDSDNIKLHTINWNGCGKTVLLLTGLGDTAHHFHGLARRLREYFNVIGLTRRGHGQSERPNTGYDLDTFLQDITCTLDTLDVKRVCLIGHSFGGIEAAHFAIRYPQRVEATVLLDALFPKLEPEPDLSGDPIWSVIPVGAPTTADLESRAAYFAYCKRVRPDKARIWCPAIEADLMSKVVIRKDGSLEFHHDDALMNSIYSIAISSLPEYGKIKVPMLAIVPDGNFHQSVPLDAAEAFRQEADKYWQMKILPWLRQRTKTFLQQAPSAFVVKLDSPYHLIFIAEEEKIANIIIDFLTGEGQL